MTNGRNLSHTQEGIWSEHQSTKIYAHQIYIIMRSGTVYTCIVAISGIYNYEHIRQGQKCTYYVPCTACTVLSI